MNILSCECCARIVTEYYCDKIVTIPYIIDPVIGIPIKDFCLDCFNKFKVENNASKVD